MKHHVKAILWTVFSLATCFVFFEGYLLFQVWHANLQDPSIWRILFYSNEISRTPNLDLAFRMYGKNAEPEMGADVHFNNIGCISKNNYYNSKAKNEFRILVIGGEQTASSVSNVSWPDHLQDILNESQSKFKFSVINLGWPDAGPAHYVKYWKTEGVLFNPDLVIVNYVETDFYRTIDGLKAKYRGKPIISWPRIKYPIGNAYAHTGFCCISHAPATSFASTNGIPSRPYGFFAPPSEFKDPNKVLIMQKKIVKDLISGMLSEYYFGELTWKSIKRGKSYIPMAAQMRDFDSLPASPIDKEKLIDFGVEHFGWLTQNIPNLIIAHNFHFGELSSNWDLTQGMIKRKPSIKVVDMRKYIPQNTSKEIIKSWYHIPHMSEKWNDKGHLAYAEMMSRMILESPKFKQLTK